MAYYLNNKTQELVYYEKLSMACMYTGETVKMKLYAERAKNSLFEPENGLARRNSTVLLNGKKK